LRKREKRHFYFDKRQQKIVPMSNWWVETTLNLHYYYVNKCLNPILMLDQQELDRQQYQRVLSMLLAAKEPMFVVVA